MRGNTRLELAWTVVPVVILVAIASFVFYKLPGITDPAEAGEPLHDQGRGPPVLLALRLRERRRRRRHPARAGRPRGRARHDRARERRHPQLLDPGARRQARRDPGPGTTQRFVAKRTGRFEGQCGELCGIQHAAMTATVEALPPPSSTPGSGSRRGLGSERPGARPRAVGGRLRQVPPAGRGVRRAGARRQPTLGDLEALEASCETAAGAMPAVGQGWTEREIDALVAFTRTLLSASRARRRRAARGEDAAMAARAAARLPGPLAPRPRHRWLTTVDHKRIGILYIARSLFFFVAGGIMALLIRTQLITPDNDLIVATTTTSSSRCTGRR